MGSLAEIDEVREKALHLPGGVLEPCPQPFGLPQGSLGFSNKRNPSKNVPEWILQLVQDHGKELSVPIGGKRMT
jgi:hypothetical protein